VDTVSALGKWGKEYSEKRLGECPVSGQVANAFAETAGRGAGNVSLATAE